MRKETVPGQMFEEDDSVRFRLMLGLQGMLR